jgi:hypothetical protein
MNFFKACENVPIDRRKLNEKNEVNKNVERGGEMQARLNLSHLKFVFLFLILGQVSAFLAFILEMSNRYIRKMFNEKVNRIEVYKC